MLFATLPDTTSVYERNNISLLLFYNGLSLFWLPVGRRSMEVEEQLGIEWLKEKEWGAGTEELEGVAVHQSEWQRIAVTLCHLDTNRIDDDFCLDHHKALQKSHFLLTVWQKNENNNKPVIQSWPWVLYFWWFASGWYLHLREWPSPRSCSPLCMLVGLVYLSAATEERKAWRPYHYCAAGDIRNWSTEDYENRYLGVETSGNFWTQK